MSPSGDSGAPGGAVRRARPWRTMARATTTRALLGGLAVLALLSGCGGPRLETDPLTPTEIEQLADGIDENRVDHASLRVAGSAMLTTDDRKSPFTFAALYDRPRWLRADIRPSSPAAPSGFTAQFLADEGCATLFFPSSLALVRDCFEAATVGDPALLLFGELDGDLVRSLDSPRLGTLDEELVLTGTQDGAELRLTLDAETLALARAEFTWDDSWLTVEYEERGWKQSLSLPRVTLARFGEKGRTRASLRIELDRLRSIDAVDRTAHDIVAPPGTPVSRWGDLALWR